MSTGLAFFFAFALAAAVPAPKAENLPGLGLMRGFHCDRYGPASGMIRSVIRTSWHDGLAEEVTIHFKDHGARQVYFVTDGHSRPLHVTLVDHGTITQFDPTTRKGYRWTLPLESGTVMGCTMPTFNGHGSPWRFAELPSRTLLGHEAAGRSVEGKGFTFKAWSWENIPLYAEEAFAATKTTLEVIDLQLGPQPPAVFEMPPDLEIEPAKPPGLPRAGP